MVLSNFSVKPVYGAQYPPLKQNTDLSSSPSKTEQKFRNYEKRLNIFFWNLNSLLNLSVSDVWDTAVSVDDGLVLSTAARVLERHAAGQIAEENFGGGGMARNEDSVMPNCYPALSKHHKAQAMQRLATQRGKILHNSNDFKLYFQNRLRV
jgi:hypothetical protein